MVIKGLKIFCLFLFLIEGNVGFAQQDAVLRIGNEEKVILVKNITLIPVYDTSILLTDDFQSALADSMFSTALKKKKAEWCLGKLNFEFSPRSKNIFLEFGHHQLDYLYVWKPIGEHYVMLKNGSKEKFDDRDIHHKDNYIKLSKLDKKQGVIYFLFKSKEKENFSIVVSNLNSFLALSLGEYLLLGVMLGIVIIVCLYNLLMLIALREKQFLYYILFVLVFGIYLFSISGVLFQYLWPRYPYFNFLFPKFMMFFVIMFGALFTREFLNTKLQFPLFDKVVYGIIVIRGILMVIDLIFESKWIEGLDTIVLSFGVFVGAYVYQQGVTSVRFYVLGYGCLLLSVCVKILVFFMVLPESLFLNHIVMIGFSLDLLFLSFAMADKVSIIKQDKERAHKKIIQSLEKNQKLKDKVNRELEAQVALRTIELNENNKLLREANEKLQQQSEEINRMNLSLDLDNRALQKGFKESLFARIMKSNVDFDEFKQVFPDSIACNKYLQEKKDNVGFTCVKCQHTKHSSGPRKFSRRCTKCGYVESVTANTIFHGVKFPIEKAFYIFYLTVTSQDEFTIDELSEMVDLRRNTCWNFKNKVKKALDDNKLDANANLSQAWDIVLL